MSVIYKWYQASKQGADKHNCIFSFNMDTHDKCCFDCCHLMRTDFLFFFLFFLFLVATSTEWDGVNVRPAATVCHGLHRQRWYKSTSFHCYWLRDFCVNAHFLNLNYHSFRDGCCNRTFCCTLDRWSILSSSRTTTWLRLDDYENRTE